MQGSRELAFCMALLNPANPCVESCEMVWCDPAQAHAAGGLHRVLLTAHSPSPPQPGLQVCKEFVGRVVVAGSWSGTSTTNPERGT